MNVRYFSYVFFVLISTLFSFTSSNWFWSWVIIELGLYSMMPLILNYVYIDNFVIESKFFLIQSLGSVFIFVGFIFLVWDISLYFIVFGFVLKFGLFPFLSLIISVCFGLSWEIFWLFSVWQKFSSLYFFSIFYKCVLMYFYMYILSTLLLSLVYMYVVSILNIFIISSSFVYMFYVYLIIISSSDFVIYYFVYCLISLVIYLYFSHLNILDFFNISLLDSLSSFFFIINIMSYAGFPPLCGFYIKVIVLELLIDYFFFFFFFFYIISLYMYIRFVVMLFLNNVFFFNFSVSYLCYYSFFLIFVFIYLLW